MPESPSGTAGRSSPTAAPRRRMSSRDARDGRVAPPSRTAPTAAASGRESRHSALGDTGARSPPCQRVRDRKSTRLNSSHGYISYAVFCLKKKKNIEYRRDAENLKL